MLKVLNLTVVKLPEQPDFSILVFCFLYFYLEGISEVSFDVHWGDLAAY